MSTPRFYKCAGKNRECPYVHDPLEIAEGESFRCPFNEPGCDEQSAVVVTRKTGSPTSIKIIIALLAFCICAFLLLPRKQEPNAVRAVTAETPPSNQLEAEIAAPPKPPESIPEAHPAPVRAIQPTAVKLRIHAPGSTAPLISKLAEGFWKSQGYKNVETTEAESKIRVTSGLGDDEKAPEGIQISVVRPDDIFAHLATQVADLVVSWRPPTAEESIRLAPVCDAASPACARVLALDAAALLVHPGQVVQALSADHAGAIWAGNLPVWSSLGGSQQDIELHLMSEDHPLADILPQALKNHTASRGRIHRHVSPEELADSVASDVAGLGLAPMRFRRNARTLAISTAPGGLAFQPTPFTVAREEYAFSRRLWVYNITQPANPLVQAFIHFAIGTDGQDIVSTAGYAGQNLRPEIQPLPTYLSAHPSFPPALNHASAEQLNFVFLFATGKDDIDLKAQQDILRFVDFMKNRANQEKKIVLAGFADERGSAALNDELSSARARRVAEALRPLGLVPAAQLGLGTQMPVDSRSTEEAWRLNRRVVPWLLQP